MENKLYHDFYVAWVKHDPLLFDIYPLDFPKLKKHFQPGFNYRTVYPNYLSKVYRQKSLEITKEFLKRALKMPQPHSLDLKVFIYYLKNDLESYQYPFHLLPISQVSNTYANRAEEASGDGYYTFSKKEDYLNYIERMRQFQVYSSEIINNLREGIESKIVLPKRIVEKLIEQLKKILKNKSYYNSNAPKNNPDFNAEMDCLIGGQIQRMINFLEGEYLQKTRKTLGIGAIDPKMYQYCARGEVTDPKVKVEDIYQVGLQEVHRIEKEMREILSQLEGKEFKKRTDYVDARIHYETAAKNFFKTKKEALDAYEKIRSDIKKTVLDPYFPGIKISHDYQIKPVPKHNAGDHSAYYYEPNQDLTRKGTFYLNANNPQQLSKGEVLALSLHEGNPGHHMQLTYKLDHLKSSPEYLKIYDNLTAYVEGWGLYSETLGDYSGQKGLIQKYGQLKMEMLRSLRLVLDVGIHHYGWSFGKACNYYLKYLSDDQKSIEKEVLRYAADPGQALAYKMGQLSFLKMKDKYLKKGLSLKEFHLKCFQKGELPLSLFEEELEKEIKK